MNNFPLSFILAFLFYLFVHLPIYSFEDSKSSKIPEVYELNKKIFELLEKKQPSEALSLARRSIQLDNKYYYSYNLCARALNNLGRKQEALQYFNYASELAPDEPASWLAIADIYRDSNDIARAKQYYKLFTRKFPQDYRTNYVYQVLARIAAEQHDGLEYYENSLQVLKLKPNDESLWLSAAQDAVYYKLPDQISYFCNEFIKRFPKNEKIIELKQALQQLQHDKERQQLDILAKKSEKAYLTDKLLDQFVVAYDSEKTKVSPHTVALVKVGLSKIPIPLIQSLFDANYKVVVAPYIIDVCPEIAEGHPRGWSEKATWHNVDGTVDYGRKIIIIGEKYKSLENGQALTGKEPDRTAFHEFGHAYDYFLGRFAKDQGLTEKYECFSHSKIFRDAYENDLKNIPEKHKKDLSYYLQSGTAGGEELFAEMFPLLFGGTPVYWSSDNILDKCFPNVLKVMKERAIKDPNYLRVMDLYDSHVHNYK